MTCLEKFELSIVSEQQLKCPVSERFATQILALLRSNNSFEFASRTSRSNCVRAPTQIVRRKLWSPCTPLSTEIVGARVSKIYI